VPPLDGPYKKVGACASLVAVIADAMPEVELVPLFQAVDHICLCGAMSGKCVDQFVAATDRAAGLA